MDDRTVWLAERYAVQKHDIDTDNYKQLFKEAWSKYLRKHYTWSVDLMVGINLKDVPLAEYKLGYYAEKLSA